MIILALLFGVASCHPLMKMVPLKKAPCSITDCGTYVVIINVLYCISKPLMAFVNAFTQSSSKPSIDRHCMHWKLLLKLVFNDALED